LLRKAKVRAVFMVVADVFREQPFQVVFIEPDDMSAGLDAAATTCWICQGLSKEV
jgi:hypothetical protein